MTTHRWRAPLALALALALTGAACSDDKSTTETGGSDRTEAVEGSTIRFAPQDFRATRALASSASEYS